MGFDTIEINLVCEYYYSVSGNSSVLGPTQGYGATDKWMKEILCTIFG